MLKWNKGPSIVHNTISVTSETQAAPEVEGILPVPDNETPDQRKLDQRWVFWYLIPNRSGQANNWGEYLHPLHSFTSIEGFQRILNSVEHPGKLLKGCRYYMFKDNIKPLWEDQQLQSARQILIEMEKTPQNGPEIEEKWIELSIDALSGQFNDLDTIVGIEINSRVSSWKVAIWVVLPCPVLEEIKQRLQLIFPNGDVSVNSMEEE